MSPPRRETRSFGGRVDQDMPSSIPALKAAAMLPIRLPGSIMARPALPCIAHSMRDHATGRERFRNAGPLRNEAERVDTASQERNYQCRFQVQAMTVT